MQSLETCNLRDRDSQESVLRRVSRPRPSLDTPSLLRGYRGELLRVSLTLM